ncbi:MAG: GNAT family N-acetyltransferase/peptidase C39 family protein [Gammaproteobacteria bacterium]|nr:GNAT family N-acetyltransferase/peptidase C39 family protein [Gammaproteobacteria bacterium]
MIRPATLKDLDALVDIETRSFIIDRFSRRSFRYLLTKANAVNLVEERNSKLCGYVTLLFNTGTSLARLYSLAVDPECRHQGVGSALIAAAEQSALENECITLRLEVRKDNSNSIQLYRKLGYKEFGTIHDYYEDHMEALRMEKHLVSNLNPDLVRVPYYEQTLDFTCGPSALMMAMKAIDPDIVLDRSLELRLWRESTTIFMTSGHGGCGPYGMALAAYRRGFDVEIYVNEEGTLLIDSVRSQEKKDVIALVQQDFIQEIKKLPIKLHHGTLSVDEIQKKSEEGGIPIVLISSYRIYHEKFPHWVVVTGFDDKYIYVHDPYVDYEANKSSIDCVNMPILKKDFQRMARYGKAGQKSVIVIKKPTRKRS